MFRDCDYIKTKDGIIFIVVGDNHPENKVRAKTVYIPDEDGSYIDKLTNQKYVKKIEEYSCSGSMVGIIHPEYLPNKKEPIKSLLIPISDIVQHYKPREKTKEYFKQGTLKNSKWEALILAINKVAGVPVKDIGIYGSHLVGLNTDKSDVDIIIYGRNNLKQLRDNFDQILEISKIQRASREQRIARVATWEKYSAITVDKLQRMESRRWSRVNVEGDDITSIRFVCGDDEISKNSITSPLIREITTHGIVAESVGTHFCPRIAKVTIDGKVLEIISYGFLFFSCVSDGDEVEIFGNYRKDGNREYITLDDPSHYICPTTEI